MKTENNGKTLEQQGFETRRWWYRNRVIALILSVIMAVCLVPIMGKTEEVFAEEIETFWLGADKLKEGFDTANAATVWYGYNNDPTNTLKENYKWRVVGFNGVDSDTNTLSVSGEMTLIAAGNIKTGVQFNTSSNYNSKYDGSNLQSEINNNIVTQLKGAEKTAIKARLLEGNEDSDTAYSNGNIIWGNDVNAIMWPLSYKEAQNSLNANVRTLKANDATYYHWWLRSPGFDVIDAAFVDRDGDVYGVGSLVVDTFGVRPAFYLNLSSIIFTSLISGTAGTAGAEYKLTIKDDDLSIAVTTGAAVTLVNTGSNMTVTVPYSITDASNTSQPNTVSVVVTDGEWTEANGWKNVTKFQHVSEGVTPSGEGNDTTPCVTGGTKSFLIDLSKVTTASSPVWGKDYHVYILAEDVKVDDAATEGINESQLTDYASAPVEIEHAHEFTYAEVAMTNGKKIVATCSNANGKCNLGNSTEHKVELAISAPAYNTYGSTGSKLATLTGLAAFNAATGKNVKATEIKYVGINGTNYTESTVPPTDPGKYKAYITVSGKNAEVLTAEVSYEISKADTAVSTNPSATAITYGDTLAESSISGGKVTASISGESTSVDGAFKWETATTKPTVSDSGVTTYKAVFTPNDSTNYKTAEVALTLTVNPKEIKVNGIKAVNKTHDGNDEAELDLNNVKLEGVIDSDKDKLGVTVKGKFEDSNAGKNKKVIIYELQLTGDVAANYKLAASGQQAEATAEIFKLDARIKDVPVAKTGLVYTGDDLELITKGKAENGTLVYALTEKGAAAPADDKYSSDIPKAVNAGEYKVYYKVIGDTNYNDVAVATIDVAIKRASQEAPKLTSTDETVSGKNDGTISGLTTAMEISTEGADKGFSTVTDISGTGFVPGTYFVRYAEDKNHDASVSVTITIKAGANAPKPDPKSQPDPVIPTPIVTSVPEEPDTGSTTVMNNDGSTTTTTKAKNEDGTITESTVREWKNGDKNVTEIIKDADGNTLSTLVGTVRISKKGTKTERTDIKKADGFHSSSSVKTYKSGKEVTSSSTSFANGAKQAYTETKNADGTLTRKVMDTNTKGKSTLTVTTKKLVKTVTKYKVTGDGKIRLTSIKTEGDTAIIPKTVTFDGEKNMIVSLGKGLFKGMEGIKEIYIYAENLKKIYAGAFNGVPADAKFYIKATTTNCKKIVRMIKKSGFGKVDYTKI